MMGFRLTAPRVSEHQEQIEDVKALKILLRPGVCWTSVDHAHSFNKELGRSGKPIGLLEAEKRKARGVRAGIPDYLFWNDGRGYAIERKVGKNRLSDAQIEFHDELRVAGIPIATCRSLKQMLDTLGGWGLLRPFKVAA